MRQQPIARSTLETPTRYHQLLTAVVGVTRYLRRDKICLVKWGYPKSERPVTLSETTLRVRQLERIHGK